MDNEQFDLGVIGLGTMGQNLLFNMADHGFAVAGYDRDVSKVKNLQHSASASPVFGARSLEEFIAVLSKPRAVLLLVPAGEIVDQIVKDLLFYLEPGDLIIDGGNSHFMDTNRRQQELAPTGIHFLGMGISGGAEGARHGPSLMPGGAPEAWTRIKPIMEATAAKVKEEPCVAWMGKGSAGHYVKMAHNGIEYGLMQLLAEAYDIMQQGLNLNNEEIGAVFHDWNETELNSFLVEITAEIFQQKDELTKSYLIDQILDKSKQKGTGKWTSQSAMDLQVPLPVIDMAVAMRDMSGYKTERVAAAKLMQGPDPSLSVDRAAFLQRLKDAVYFSFIITYAQGMAQLRAASDDYDYELNLAEVARIWRGGCIIRAALLEPFRAAFEQQPDLPNLLVAPNIIPLITDRQQATRDLIQAVTGAGIPAPGIMAALSYFDTYRRERLPANLIQAQRDFFGSHTYERIDREGTFHTDWGAG